MTTGRVVNAGIGLPPEEIEVKRFGVMERMIAEKVVGLKVSHRRHSQGPPHQRKARCAVPCFPHPKNLFPKDYRRRYMRSCHKNSSQAVWLACTPVPEACRWNSHKWSACLRRCEQYRIDKTVPFDAKQYRSIAVCVVQRREHHLQGSELLSSLAAVPVRPSSECSRHPPLVGGPPV